MDIRVDNTNEVPTTRSRVDNTAEVGDGETQPLITDGGGIDVHGAGTTLSVKIRWFVYLSHSLSAWGDRMWQFGVGLFLVIIAPGSLRLTAIYGLSSGGATLLFGTLVGDWVDQTPRLRAAQTTLILQNMSVLLCSGAVFAVITYREIISDLWPDQRLLDLCYGVIILLAVIASLASMGTTIAIERDWIVEICGRQTDILASMSATLRRIDLMTNIVAPIVTGQVMAYGSERIGALFIGSWNLVSVFVEYYLLWKVYDLVPALHSKKYRDVKMNEEENPEHIYVHGETEDILPDNNTHKQYNKDRQEVQHPTEVYGNRVFENENIDNDPRHPTDTTKLTVARQQHRQGVCTNCGSCLMKVFSGVVSIGCGWRTYMKYDVAFAGLALAALYMTVLGFDNVTVGYAYSQGVNESMMGVLMATGALTGILGTLVYPGIKRSLGLQRTGLLGMFLEVSLLCLCVGSVWAPGSPFDPFHTGSVDKLEYVAMETNVSLVMNASSTDGMGLSVLTADMGRENETAVTMTMDIPSSSDWPFVTMATGNDTNSVEPVVDSAGQSYIAVGLLMAGIIGARCGLWLTDLTVTQLFLEAVPETERGVANGVQISLNMLMDMLKFLLVIVIPEPRDYGFLVLISFGATVLGWALFAKYSYTSRGHLLHVEKLYKCACVKRDDGVGSTRNGYRTLDGER